MAVPFFGVSGHKPAALKEVVASQDDSVNLQIEEKKQLQHKQGGGGREQVVNLQDGMNVTGQPNASWRKGSRRYLTA
eukprot:scaffold42526_cov167-Skeletonema_dohrnii-CCMP3373.AAC.1